MSPSSLNDELLTLGHLYRDRGDCENAFDELKNQWGWGGFTTAMTLLCKGVPDDFQFATPNARTPFGATQFAAR